MGLSVKIQESDQSRQVRKLSVARRGWSTFVHTGMKTSAEMEKLNSYIVCRRLRGVLLQNGKY